MAGLVPVIPGHAKVVSPESITACRVIETPTERILTTSWLWIPGSALRAAPE